MQDLRIFLDKILIGDQKLALNEVVDLTMDAISEALKEIEISSFEYQASPESPLLAQSQQLPKWKASLSLDKSQISQHETGFRLFNRAKQHEKVLNSNCKLCWLKL